MWLRAVLLGCTVSIALLPAARATVVTVGAGAEFATLNAAVAAAHAGDTIDIAPGTYTDQTADITKPLTIEGTGAPGSVVFNATHVLNNDKAFLVIDADTTVRNITFENALADPSSSNGAGIRYQNGNLTVLNSRFIDNQDGIMGNPAVRGTGSITVRGSYFSGNGVADGDLAGYEHAIYAGPVAILTVTTSTFQGTQQGHDIKSRAADSIILDNYLDDGVTGTTSYAIDLPNGGDATIIGNTIEQGGNSPNWTMLAYGAEGLTWESNVATIDGNRFGNTLPEAIGVYDWVSNPAQAQVTVTCNAFDSVPTPTLGPVLASGNVDGSSLPACAMASGIPTPNGPATLLPGLSMFALWRRARRVPGAARFSPGGPSCAGSSC